MASTNEVSWPRNRFKSTPNLKENANNAVDQNSMSSTFNRIEEVLVPIRKAVQEL